MKRIFVVFLLISICGCANSGKLNIDGTFKTCNADAKSITLNPDQATTIYNIFKNTKLDNEIEPHDGCLVSYEFNVDGKAVTFTVVNKDVIADNYNTYKIDDIALYVETAKIYYDVEDKPLVTLDDIKSLVNEKGQDLSYEDLKDYLHYDVGSGLIIYEFPIDTNYTLFVSDFNDEIKPDYIELYNNHEKIDIRFDNIDKFIKQD